MAGAAPLTNEQGRFIDAQVKLRGRQQLLVGRSLAHVSGPYGFGAESIGYDILTEMSAARITTNWGDWSEDLPGIGRVNKAIPVLVKPFRINARQLAASQMSGTALDVTALNAAIYQVGLAEDDLIVMGKTDDAGTSYIITGFYNTASCNTEGSADDFGTEAYVYAKLALAEAELQTDSIYPPYNIVLANTQYNQLLAHCASTAVPIKDAVEKRIEGKAFRSADLATDTGMLIATADQGFFDIAVGVDLNHKSVIVEPKGDLYGIVFECLVPRVFDANSICTLTLI